MKDRGLPVPAPPAQQPQASVSSNSGMIQSLRVSAVSVLTLILKQPVLLLLLLSTLNLTTVTLSTTIFLSLK